MTNEQLVARVRKLEGALRKARELVAGIAKITREQQRQLNNNLGWPFDTESIDVPTAEAKEAKAVLQEIDVALSQPATKLAKVPEGIADAQRYRYLKEYDFRFADVSLTADYDQRPFVRFRPTFDIPEPVSFPHSYDEEEWTPEMFDAAIDAALNAAGGAR